MGKTEPPSMPCAGEQMATPPIRIVCNNRRRKVSYSLPLPVNIPKLPSSCDPMDTSPPLPRPNLLPQQNKFQIRKPFVTRKTPEAPKKGRRTPNRSFSTPSHLQNLSLSSHVPLQVELHHPGLEVLENIGSGSQGEVFKVRDKDKNLFYAVKVLKTLKLTISDQERIHKEISNVKKVSPHPHLLSYQHTWEYDHQTFLQMELCECSLSDFLSAWQKDNPCQYLAENIFWSFLTDIALGLAELHQNGLLHRDIKPANIFVAKSLDNGGSKKLMLGDFGLLVELDDEDGREGDSRYLSIEAMNQVQSYASDIFSFGATLFEMATLMYMPPNGKLWDDIRTKNISKLDVFHTPVYSDSLIILIGSMLQEDANRRPTTNEILAHPVVAANIRNRAMHGRLTSIPPKRRRQRSTSSPFLDDALNPNRRRTIEKRRNRALRQMS